MRFSMRTIRLPGEENKSLPLINADSTDLQKSNRRHRKPVFHRNGRKGRNGSRGVNRLRVIGKSRTFERQRKEIAVIARHRPSSEKQKSNPPRRRGDAEKFTTPVGKCNAAER